MAFYTIYTLKRTPADTIETLEHWNIEALIKNIHTKFSLNMNSRVEVGRTLWTHFLFLFFVFIIIFIIMFVLRIKKDKNKSMDDKFHWIRPRTSNLELANTISSTACRICARLRYERTVFHFLSVVNSCCLFFPSVRCTVRYCMIIYI